jgi:hypothetical protein
MQSFKLTVSVSVSRISNISLLIPSIFKHSAVFYQVLTLATFTIVSSSIKVLEYI